MSRLLAYLVARLKEPGSQRSLAVVLWGLTSATNSTDIWQAGIGLGITLLGGASFLQVEAKPMVVSVSDAQTVTAVGVAAQTQDKPA